jgi:hypothetical protein
VRLVALEHQPIGRPPLPDMFRRQFAQMRRQCGQPGSRRRRTGKVRQQQRPFAFQFLVGNLHFEPSVAKSLQRRAATGFVLGGHRSLSHILSPNKTIIV